MSSFWSGPQVSRGMTAADFLTSALDQPMSLSATLWDQAKGGALESFGLGTAIRELSTPDPIASGRSAPAPGEGGSMTEEEFKASADYRTEVPFDRGMTPERQRALAEMYDIKKAREFYASKRPVTAFIGNLVGQVPDPINYIPFLGPATKAAAVTRFGKIGGTALVAGADAALNTAVAAGLTAGARAKFGDDVSWETAVSQVATAALIGGAFGTIGGALGRRADAKQAALVQQAGERLATLRRTQEARIVLNDAVQSLALDGEVRLSPAMVDAVQRTGQAIEASKAKFVTIDYLYSVADERQKMLAASADSIARDLQIEFLNPGVKARARAEEKIASKGYTSATDLTDIVRGGFKVLTPQQADDAVNRLSSRFRVTDEGWKTTAAGYFDRKAIVEFDDGVRAEVQMWHPELLRAKEELGGHRLYEEARVLPEGDPRKAELELQMLELYEAARASLPPDWMGALGRSPKRVENSSAVSASASTRKSVELPGTQDPRLNTNARPGSQMAGLPAQSPYFMGATSEESLAVDARIGKRESLKDLAAQYGVDPETGDFTEAPELEQLRATGRLTQQEEAEIKAADEALEIGSAYGEAIKAAVACLL